MHELNIDPWFLEKAKRGRGGRLNAYQSLNPEKTALVIVDMQEYYVADSMPASAAMARDIVPNINRLAAAVRKTGGLVVWIQTEARVGDWASMNEALPDVFAKRQPLLTKNGGLGYPFYESCEVLPTDVIAAKTRYSSFLPYPSELEVALKHAAVDTLLITGVATSTCCESTARDAVMLDYRTIMVSDGNADHTNALHNHTLGKFLVTFGDVQSTDELILKLNSENRPTPWLSGE